MIEVNSRNVPLVAPIPGKTKCPVVWRRFQCVQSFFCKPAATSGTLSNSQDIVASKKWTIQRKADVAFGILLLITGIALCALGISSGFAPAGLVGGLMVLGGLGGIFSKGAPRPHFCT